MLAQVNDSGPFPAIMIKVSHLTKRFGSVTAVDDLSFEIAAGEIVGFLGPNGAGKTTTMRILSCFLPATGGSIEIDGLDVFKQSVEVRRRIGYLPENCPLYPEMRVVEYLRYRAELKGLSGSRRRRRVYDVLSRCGLEDERRRLIGHLSKGYRQRVGLADSLLSEPAVLILDEPGIGLDPGQRLEICRLIHGLAEDHTVLLSTHLLADVERICGRALIINDGRIVASDTPDNLVKKLKGHPRVTLEVHGPRHDVEAAFRRHSRVAQVHWRSVDDGWHLFEVECDDGDDVRPDLFREVVAGGWQLREMRCEVIGLEDAFIAVTTEGLQE
tara:strand:- start:1612 stop:2595 length:984 start_codon:yes stop_codon:yes gene_type:complete